MTKMEKMAKNTKNVIISQGFAKHSNDIGFALRLTCEATFYQIQLNQIYQTTVQSMEVVPIMYFCHEFHIFLLLLTFKVA